MTKFELPFSKHDDSHLRSDRSDRGDKGRALKLHMVAASGEFIGTFLFLFFAFATHLMAADQAGSVSIKNGQSSSQTVVFVSLGYGFALLAAAWTMYRVSGGLFNPAVTFGLCIAGALPWVRGLILFPAQMLGGMAAAGLVSCMFPGDIAVVNTKLAPGVSIAQGLFIEMFLTAQLVLAIMMLAVEKSKDTFLAPIGIGLSLFVAELAGVNYTGGSLNPARSFGPAVASRSFDGYHWVYWLGPVLGSALAALYYKFVKYMHYEDANPDQDSAGGDFHR